MRFGVSPTKQTDQKHLRQERELQTAKGNHR